MVKRLPFAPFASFADSVVQRFLVQGFVSQTFVAQEFRVQTYEEDDR